LVIIILLELGNQSMRVIKMLTITAPITSVNGGRFGEMSNLLATQMTDLAYNNDCIK